MNCVQTVIAIGVFAVVAISAKAEIWAHEIQPDHLPFGTVHTGAIVEGSFLVTVPGKDPHILFSIWAPKFVKVLHQTTEHMDLGPGKDFVCGSVEFSIDTSFAADLSGEFKVKLGEAVANIPISATVTADRKGLARLLVVETPFEMYSTRNGDDFKIWTDLVKDASLDANYLQVTRGKPVLRDLTLGNFDCVLLACSGLIYLQPSDIKRVREFVEAGGRVVVSANAFYEGTVEKANAVLAGYGLEMHNEEAQGHDANVTVEKDDLAPDLVKEGVQSAHFFRASPISVTNDKAARVWVKALKAGKPGDGFVASAKAGKGEVVAFGDSLWWEWVTKGSDNAQLMRLLVGPLKEK